MRSINQFIVKLDKKFNDEVETEGGLKLYVDTKFNEFEHRVCEAEVIATPEKYDTGVKAGDTLYFHHRVVMDKKPLTASDNYYLVSYDPEVALSSEAIAYKDEDGVHMLSEWVLIEKPEQEERKEEKTESGIFKVSFEKRTLDNGVLRFASKEVEVIGANIGDNVYFNPKIAYLITVEGKKYFRMRIQDLLYVKN